MLTVSVRNFVKRTLGRGFSSLAKAEEHTLDPTQESLLSEKCFLVDANDTIIGQASKRECHLVQKDGEIPLHRAFSVFLFNKRGDLLLQKRASQKITYPDYYANSCCSHPIADFPDEDEETNAIGVKRAARRRLNYELGIPLNNIPLDELHYITRFHYKDEGNGKWGEHEIDYVLFWQTEVKIQPNNNEVSEISFISRKGFDQFLATLNLPLTPWFRMVSQHRLKFWWDNLDNLDKIKDHKTILKFPSN